MGEMKSQPVSHRRSLWQKRPPRAAIWTWVQQDGVCPNHLHYIQSVSLGRGGDDTKLERMFERERQQGVWYSTCGADREDLYLPSSRKQEGKRTLRWSVGGRKPNKQRYIKGFRQSLLKCSNIALEKESVLEWQKRKLRGNFSLCRSDVCFMAAEGLLPRPFTS